MPSTHSAFPRIPVSGLLISCRKILPASAGDRSARRSLRSIIECARSWRFAGTSRAVAAAILGPLLRHLQIGDEYVDGELFQNFQSLLGRRGSSNAKTRVSADIPCPFGKLRKERSDLVMEPLGNL